MKKIHKAAFTTGFEKCKSIIQAQSPSTNAESLQANSSDESLTSTMNNGIETIMAVVWRFAYVSIDSATNPTTIIEVGKIDEDGFRFMTCIIGDHLGANPSLRIIEVDDAGPFKSK